jgi:hypothetical protein
VQDGSADAPCQPRQKGRGKEKQEYGGVHARNETGAVRWRQAALRIGAFLSCAIRYAGAAMPSGEMASHGGIGW